MKMYGLTLDYLVYKNEMFSYTNYGGETIVGLIVLASLIDAFPTLQVFFDNLEEDGGSAIEWEFSVCNEYIMFGYFGELTLYLRSYPEFTKVIIMWAEGSERIALEFSSR